MVNNGWNQGWGKLLFNECKASDLQDKKISGDLFHNYVKILTTIQLVLVAQSCLTLCDSMDCSLPGSSVHGILQARILEWVAIPFSRGSSQPRDGTQVSYTVGRFFTI